MVNPAPEIPEGPHADADLAAPLAHSLQHVLATLMQIDVDAGEPRPRTEPLTTHPVSGIAALSGGVRGLVVVSMPEGTARRLVALFIGRQSEPSDPEFADAVCEMTTMIVGGAKGNFGAPAPVGMACPSVVVGRRHAVNHAPEAAWWVMNCQTDCGDLTIELALVRAGGASASPADQGATVHADAGGRYA